MVVVLVVLAVAVAVELVACSTEVWILGAFLAPWWSGRVVRLLPATLKESAVAHPQRSGLAP